MAMCTTRLGESFESTEQRSRTYFHIPGPETTKQYLEQVSYSSLQHAGFLFLSTGQVHTLTPGLLAHLYVREEHQEVAGNFLHRRPVVCSFFFLVIILSWIAQSNMKSRKSGTYLTSSNTSNAHGVGLFL